MIAFDSSGAPFIGALSAGGDVSVAGGGVTLSLSAWNRAAPKGLALMDANWGPVTDSATGRVEIVLRGPAPLRIAAIDTTPQGTEIPSDGAVLVAGPATPAATRRALLALHTGDTVRVTVSLSPFHPLDAAGGFPVLVRDSLVVIAPDSVTSSNTARVRHPRTAIGIGRAGRRLLLVTVDGRQSPYSDGMTLRELAELMRSLGARDALNLDGGGSTTFVAADPASGGSTQVWNRPSDKEGERPVANALAIVAGCRSTRSIASPSGLPE